MSPTFLVTCWICRRLHVPVEALALHPVCRDCRTKAVTRRRQHAR